MRRLPKILIGGFLAYAVVAASPEQQARMLDGALAVKDAAFEACTREDGMCAQAISGLMAALGPTLHDGPDPWMDEDDKRGSRITVMPPP